MFAEGVMLIRITKIKGLELQNSRRSQIVKLRNIFFSRASYSFAYSAGLQIFMCCDIT